jgi:hypothetical protein
MRKMQCNSRHTRKSAVVQRGKKVSGQARQEVKDEGNSLHTCYVCERDYADQPLGLDMWRHKACEPGSVNWREWYAATGRQTDAGRLLQCAKTDL